MRRGVRDALAALRPWPDAILLLEDDVRLRPDWRNLLEVAVESDFPTVCCTLEVCCIPQPWAGLARAEKNGAPAPVVKPRVAPLVRPISFYGAQAVLMPAWFLQELWADDRLHGEEPRGMAFDSLLNNLMQDMPAQWGLQVLIPDMVEHLSPPSVKDPSRIERRPHMVHWRTA